MAFRISLSAVLLALSACASIPSTDVTGSNVMSVRTFFIEGEPEVVTCFDNKDCFYWDDGARKQSNKHRSVILMGARCNCSDIATGRNDTRRFNL